jgi:heme/copper-type cytochrome/quinol oxidase subunit 2
VDQTIIRSIALVDGIADIRNLATLLVFVVMGALLYLSVFSRTFTGRRQRQLFLAVAWLVIPFIPGLFFQYNSR